MSIFTFYKISTSILPFLYDFDVTFYSLYQGSRQDSTTFKVAVSHFVFYPCGAQNLFVLW